MWYLTTAQTSDLPNINADEWVKIFGTSTYCIPGQDDCEEYNPNTIQHSQHQLNVNLTKSMRLMNLSNKI